MKLTTEQRTRRMMARRWEEQRRNAPLAMLPDARLIWADDPRLVLTPSERRWKRLGYYVLGPLIVAGFVVLLAFAGGAPA